MNIAIVGSGHAGQSFALALRSLGHFVGVFHHDQARDLAGELILLCVPDSHIAEVAQLVPQGPVVAHLAGSRGLEVLAPHQRVGYLHPLAALVSPEIGAQRLLGAHYSVAGDPLVFELVESLGGIPVTIPDHLRANYHAAAAVAANHTVAFLAHLEELASEAGLQLDDYLPLVRNAIEDVVRDGVARSLTGPASRGDLQTIDAHLEAISSEERATYVALADRAFALSEAKSEIL